MPAGDSAAAEARRQLALADAHTQAAAQARASAARFGVAEVTERRTAAVLAPLSALGHHLLADRRWPGSRRAQVDLVVVGPGGVFIVDTKAWKEVSLDAQRVHRGQEDVTDEVMALADLSATAEADLAEVGLAPGEVRPVVVLAGRQGIDERVGPLRIVGEKDVLRHIASYGSRLTPSQVDVVLGRALTLFPQVTAPPPVVPTIIAPVVPRPPADDAPDLLTASDVEAALLEGVLASPIEEWMAFLHPHQARLVRRSFNGPSRIRGSAGTGKTVVGLHRAAYLARTRPGRVLMTTYVRTLPVVLHRLLARMAPDVVDRVEFRSVHSVALDVLKERGIHVAVNRIRAENGFERAWRRVGHPGLLGQSSLPRSYWQEEITSVL